MTHGDSSRTTQLPLQSTWEGSRDAGLVWVVHADNAHKTEDGDDEGSQQNSTPARGEVCVGLGREDAKHVVVLVNGLAVVATFLLVPPVGIRVTLGAFLWGRVCVASVLQSTRQYLCLSSFSSILIERTMLGSSTLISPISGEADADEALRSWEIVARGAVAWMARVSGRAAASLLDSI